MNLRFISAINLRKVVIAGTTFASFLAFASGYAQTSSAVVLPSNEAREAQGYRSLIRQSVTYNRLADDADAAGKPDPHFRRILANRLQLNQFDAANLPRLSLAYQAEVLPVQNRVASVKAAYLAKFPSGIRAVAQDAKPPAASPQHSEDELPLLNIGWTKIDLSQNHITLSGCLSVLSNGSFHLEKRVQILPERTATLEVFEGVLTSGQISRMTALLHDKKLVDLPDREFPVVPTTSYSIESVKAEISRGRAIQKVRYAVWRGSDEKNSPEDSEVAAEQLETKAALSPLLEWKDSLRGTEIDNPDPESLGCPFED